MGLLAAMESQTSNLDEHLDFINPDSPSAGGEAEGPQPRPHLDSRTDSLYA